MPKYTLAADKIAEGLSAAKNRLFELVQYKLDEGKDEKQIMKELKENHTANPEVLTEIEYTFFKKKAKAGTWGDTTKLYGEFAKWADDDLISHSDFMLMQSRLDYLSRLEEKGSIMPEQAEKRLNAYMDPLRQRVKSRDTQATKKKAEGGLSEVVSWRGLSNEEQTVALQKLVEMTGYDDAYAFDKDQLADWANQYNFNVLTLKPEVKEAKVKVKVGSNPYRQYKNADTMDDLAKYDAIMNKVSEMLRDGGITSEEYTKIKKVYDSFDDPAHITSYLEDLKDTVAKVLFNGLQRESAVGDDATERARYMKDYSPEAVVNRARYLMSLGKSLYAYDLYKNYFDVPVAEAKEKVDELVPKEDIQPGPLVNAKNASWIDEAKVGDQVDFNGEFGEVINITNEKIEIETPTKTETIWKQ